MLKPENPTFLMTAPAEKPSLNLYYCMFNMALAYMLWIIPVSLPCTLFKEHTMMYAVAPCMVYMCHHLPMARRCAWFCTGVSGQRHRWFHWSTSTNSLFKHCCAPFSGFLVVAPMPSYGCKQTLWLPCTLNFLQACWSIPSRSLLVWWGDSTIRGQPQLECITKGTQFLVLKCTCKKCLHWC